MAGGVEKGKRKKEKVWLRNCCEIVGRLNPRKLIVERKLKVQETNKG